MKRFCRMLARMPRPFVTRSICSQMSQRRRREMRQSFARFFVHNYTTHLDLRNAHNIAILPKTTADQSMRVVAIRG